MRVLAVVTARAGSKRLPGKNVRPLAGIPLIVWSIESARETTGICDVLVSTDDPVTADIARNAGALVPWLRPAELASDVATSADVCIHALDWYESNQGAVDGLLLLQPTSPFRSRESLHRGLTLFDEHGHRRRLVGVSPSKSHPSRCYYVEGERMRPIAGEGDPGTRTQDLPPVFAVNGAFYLLPPADLRNSKSFYSDDMLPLVMEEPGADVDIDTEFDWKIAELIAGQYLPTPAPRKDPGIPETNPGSLWKSGPAAANAKYRGDFYLEEDRAAEPKEIFKLLARLLEEEPFRRNGVLLDVGCATGELLHYLSHRFPELSLHGTDVNEEFLIRARRLVPGARFTLGALEDETAVPLSSVDYCIVSGVVSIFDEIEPLLSNILSWLKSGGTTLIVSQFNEDPVDVVMRYRRAEQPGTGWEKGWNIFARATVDRYLATDHRVGRWDYVPFRLPFALPRVKDPMRTWTIATDQNRYQLFNGARQMVDLSVLRIVKSSSE